MQTKLFVLALVSSVFLAGCDKQTQANTEKIESLSRKMLQLEANQSVQLDAIRTQLASLPGLLEKVKTTCIARSHDEALFYHTNTVYLLLSIDKKIGAQLQMAASEREADRSLAYYYHTNQTGTIFFCAGQIQDALAGQEIRMENSINSETRKVGNAMGDELLKQIKLLPPDKAEMAWRTEVESQLAKIQQQLEIMNARLRSTNLPAGRF